MENYYFINSVDTKNQTMNIQEVGAGEMSAQQVRITKNQVERFGTDHFCIICQCAKKSKESRE